MKYALTEFLDKCRYRTRLFWIDTRVLLWEQPPPRDFHTDHAAILAPLMKALKVGTYSPAPSLIQGVPLQIESLETVMREVWYEVWCPSGYLRRASADRDLLVLPGLRSAWARFRDRKYTREWLKRHPECHVRDYRDAGYP